MQVRRHRYRPACQAALDAMKALATKDQAEGAAERQADKAKTACVAADKTEDSAEKARSTAPRAAIKHRVGKVTNCFAGRLH